MTVPVSVHGFSEHIALLFHLVKQRQQRPAPAAALRLLGDEEIRVHHLHPEADAEHGLAGPRRIVHDLKMIRIKPRAAAEHERIAQLQRTFDHIAVAAQNADGRAAADADALGIAVDEQILIRIQILRAEQLRARYNSNDSHGGTPLWVEI